MFICPVCKAPLTKEEHSFRCKEGHSFDIAAKGYVNLLLSNHMNAKLPGDNKLMVNARADFLNKGYYSHLAEAMAAASSEYFDGGCVLDAGCGEGYYSERIYNELNKKDGFSMNCIDISKFACAKCASRFKGKQNCDTAAASIFRLPEDDGSVSLAVTMFAPFCREEFIRVLKTGGMLIMAIPSRTHLMSLKAAVYDHPYENETADYHIEGFEFVEKREISRMIHIDSPEDIRALFTMTPYYYKTGTEGHERVNALTELDTEAGFEVLIYRKK